MKKIISSVPQGFSISIRLIVSVLMSLAFFAETNCPFYLILLIGISLALFFLSYSATREWALRAQAPAQKFGILLFSICAALTTAVGGHVVRTQWFYDGHYQDNYLGIWGLNDLFWCVLLVLFMALLTLSALYAYRRLSGASLRYFVQGTPVFQRSSALFTIGLIGILICWLPYFLANYPAPLYADSLESIRQSLGLEPLENHHPVMYTLIIGGFLQIGHVLGGGYELGVALYALVQMVLVGAVLTYTLVWLNKRAVKRWLIILIGVFYAFMPIFPLHAISMWKDAPYAAFMLLLALQIADCVISRGAILHQPKRLISLAIVSLGVCFMRNNGIFVVAVSLGALAFLYAFVPWIKQRRMIATQPIKPAKTFSVMALCLLLLYGGVTGLGYQAAGVKSVPVESYAVPLEQFSAAVVYDGDLTKEQRDFANTLLPLEDYRECYIPCSVDGIKWAKHFNTNYFNNHQREFLQQWFAIGLNNPKLYFDAYVMETYEYWSMGDVQRSFTINGTNTKHYDEELGITAHNLLAEWLGNTIGNALPFGFIYPAEGVTSWVLLFLALLFLCWKKHRSYTLVLVPALASWVTLLLSAPFAGLHRYILASEFLLPIALLLPLIAAAAEQQKHNAQSKLGNS